MIKIKNKIKLYFYIHFDTRMRSALYCMGIIKNTQICPTYLYNLTTNNLIFKECIKCNQKASKTILLVNNFQERAVKNFTQVDADFGRQLSEALRKHAMTSKPHL